MKFLFAAAFNVFRDSTSLLMAQFPEEKHYRTADSDDRPTDYSSRKSHSKFSTTDYGLWQQEVANSFLFIHCRTTDHVAEKLLTLFIYYRTADLSWDLS